MFSTAQQEIIDSYVPTMLNKGYSYYIVYTNYNNGDYYNREPDLIFIFSKDKIIGSSGYRYQVPEEGSITTRIRTSNYSSNSYADNSERLVTTSYDGGYISIPMYEHIYTNAEFSDITVQPDIMQEGSQYNAVQSNAICTVLASFLLVYCFFKMWTIHR